MGSSENSGRHLILYDGVCGLCNRFNTFVLRRDPDGLFLFASLQSPLAAKVLAKYGRDPSDLDTLYLVEDYDTPDEALREKAHGALTIVAGLRTPLRLAALLRVLPAWLLNPFYALVVRNRYRVFGRSDTCPMPAPAHQARFLDV